MHPTVRELHAIQRATNNFMSLMKLKLYENIQKGKGTTWQECSYQCLRKRIDDELKELDEKIEKGLTLDAREECADIANFCMFISDNISYGHFKMEDN
jgi:hypothetical protein